MDDSGRIDTGDGAPPFGGTWRRLYAALILYLALAIGALWIFSRAFA